MTRVALDTNVLGYAELEPETAKGQRAAALISKLPGGTIIAAHVLGELLRLVQRKHAPGASKAAAQVAIYRKTFSTPPTTDAAIAVAAELALERKLQFWDALICVVAAQAGATVFFSENIQDGADIRGLRIINPFDVRNEAAVERLLGI